MKKHFKEQLRVVEAKLERTIRSEIKDQLDAVEGRIRSEINDQKAQQEATNAKLDLILQIIKKD